MAFQLPNREVSLSLGDSSSGVQSPTAGELLRNGQLCQPLMERLNRGRDQAAFDYLARETSLDVLNDCIRRIPDQQLTSYLLEQVFLTAALLSSEAFNGIEAVRGELKKLGQSAAGEDPKAARRLYDSKIEVLGQFVFAVGRRLHQIEQYMANCPLSGSSEQLRGRYAQRVRDLAGDVRFIRQELSRWVRRFVPLQRDLPQGGEGRVILEGRIDAVVDELGLRIREIQESLSSTLFEQLSIFDPSLTRKKLFRQDLENILDVNRLVGWLSELLDRVQAFDSVRQPEQLQRVTKLLSEFRPEQFPAFAGIRESDQELFVRFTEEIHGYRADQSFPEDDPIKVFLLLLGDLLNSLRHRRPTSDTG